MAKKVSCFICGKDITNSTKVASYHNYPYQYWDMDKNNWNKELPTILNGVMCQECAQNDLEVAHARATGKDKEYAASLKKQGKKDLLEELSKTIPGRILLWLKKS